MIKNYLKFTESNKNIHIGNYSIYEFCEYLKSLNWSTSDNDILASGDNYIKTWTDHFVGEGYYNKIENYVDGLIKIFDKIDIDYVRDRFSEIFDNYNDRNRKVHFGVIYKTNFNDDNYNGLIGFIAKKYLIRHIIIAIIWPTLHDKTIYFDDRDVRQLHDEIFVTNAKYNCKNATNNLTFQGSKFYDVDRIIKSYKPVIKIQIGDHNNKFILGEIEKDIENILPSILHSFDYESIMWDFFKGTRKFEDNLEVSEYSIKIVLK